MGAFLLQLLILLGALGLISLAVNLLGGTLHGLTGAHLAEQLRVNLKTFTPFKAYKAGLFSAITSLGTLKSYITILGYTNSRLMTQTRATASMRGAMAGELVLVWFVALMITIPVLNQVSLPICGLGYLSILLFPKLGELKLSARIFLAVGLMLIGITLAKSAVRDITFSHIVEASEVVVYTSNGGFSIFLGILVGIIISAALRNSTMTVIVALLLGVTLVGNHFAVGLALGAPMGLIFPLVNIAMSTNTSSRRVIVLHSINLFIATALCGVAASFITEKLLNQYETNLWVIWAYTAYALIFVPLAWWITKPTTKLVNIVIPNIPEPKKLRVLSTVYKPDASLMMLEVEEEMLRHNRRVYKMLAFLRDYLLEESDQKRTTLIERIEKYKTIADNVHYEILTYISNINTENNPQASGRMHLNINRLLQTSQVVDNLVRAGRVIDSVEHSQYRLSEAQIKAFEDIVIDIQNMLHRAISSLEIGYSPIHESEITSMYAAINDKLSRIEQSYHPYNQTQIIEISIYFRLVNDAIGGIV